MKVWWCEEHERPGNNEACWPILAYGSEFPAVNPCRMVGMRLIPEGALVIEKEEGEWPVVFADQLRFVRNGRGGTELNLDSLRLALASQVGESE